MPLAAILTAVAPSADRPDVLRGQLVFAGQTITEYQARQARQAGADRLFVMVDTVGPALSRMVDRLTADGIIVQLVRDMTTLVRMLPRDADVLLFADGVIVDQGWVGQVAEKEGDAVLVVEDGSITAALERVDAGNRWAGLAKVAPSTLFNTLDLIGDWDLVLTLMRAAVQADATRVVVPQVDLVEGRLSFVDRQEAADLVTRGTALTGSAGDGASFGLDHYVLAPVAAIAARHLLRSQVAVMHLRLIAAGLAILGCVGLFPRLWGIALLFLLAAILVDLTAERVGALSGMGSGGRIWELAPTAIVLVAIAWLGRSMGMGGEGLHLALLLALILVLRQRAMLGTVPLWAVLTPGSAVIILLLANLLGLGPTAFLLLPIAAIGSIAFVLLRREGTAQTV